MLLIGKLKAFAFLVAFFSLNLGEICANFCIHCTGFGRAMRAGQVATSDCKVSSYRFWRAFSATSLCLESKVLLSLASSIENSKEEMRQQ